MFCAGFTGGKESAWGWRRCKTGGFNPWTGKIPWRRKWQPTPVFLPGESRGQRSLAGCSPWGRLELDTPEHTHTMLLCTSELYLRTHNWVQMNDHLMVHAYIYELGVSWDSLVTQMVKNLPAMRETWVPSLGREDPLEKEMAIYSSILAWEIPWKEEHGGLHTVHGVTKSQTTVQVTQRSNRVS